ncbi:RNA-guided endonuclease InsQ/TnpB family protein [Psychrobacter sp. AOP22-C1-22]|uniref:RNA-guided endonuclease InsQ/TnpB family protein n=1 Tax=unclassified Psychrobacter TaxID=196806 RepID=UPI001787CE3D|nr:MULTISPECIES: RNA-guided endonuclease TnpB family protein [unclassified Psychrobacter]MBE0406732.1 IS200/IS605 family element transposase accessory protein TnpB [Psychrobacter sp. FME6]MBE0446378.1 IS200/IS605 family element transposase accessory protein TnpB [Psychrobacter sp. FME5]MDN5897518.1 transposase [Psychrobacter sp.]
MKINKAYKFRLEPNAEQEVILNNLVGSARFVWNQVLAVSFEMFAKNEFINATNLVNKIMDIKANPEFAFLKTSSNAVSLQQKIRDLASAWSRFFDPKVHARLKENKKKPKKPKFFKLADGTEIQLRPLMPRFKRKSDGRDSIRLVQFDKYCRVEGNRVKLPNGVGFVKFRKSQDILGIIKNVTISKKSGHWYVSFGTERELAQNPIHPSKTAVGIDLGVAKLIATSDGQVIKPKNSFKANQIKLAALQRQLSRKVLFSQNWKKHNRKIQKLHHHIANIRHDYLHKITTTISKNHAMIACEDLKVANMSKSASGSMEKKGKNVKAKSGLNKSILDQGWGMMVNMLEYKQQWQGGLLIKVNPRYTSQTCFKCKHVAKENRRTQAKFECVECGYIANADVNAARNILAAGHAVLSVEGRCSKGRPLKQKTCDGREKVA